mmetsp:Transcript_2841/g.6453  ORF Transcript_2841/g.6453 Transcript_2841/m.6453 type:complete len:109 (+) Transcript_2841:70-396(+)
MTAEEETKETTPGKVDMKVTTKKPPNFYIRSAKSFLTGIETESGKKEPVNELTISGLGEAINAAVAASMAVVGDNLATITKVETSYPGMTTNGAERGCPRIVITLAKK